jgi:hypothetical protein
LRCRDIVLELSQYKGKPEIEKQIDTKVRGSEPWIGDARAARKATAMTNCADSHPILGQDSIHADVQQGGACAAVRREGRLAQTRGRSQG